MEDKNDNIALYTGGTPIGNPAASALHLPQTLSKTPLAKLPRIHQTLLRKVDTLHVRGIGGGGTADTRGDENGVSLENDSVVDNLINGQRNKVVVLNDSALVGGTPVRKKLD